MTFSKSIRLVCVGAAFCAISIGAQAALFDDDEARKAILDLRQKVDIQQQRNTEELRRNADDLKKANEDNAQLRRSILDLANQIEVLRADLAKLRGQDEQLARDVAEVQRKQRDISQGVDERLRKFEPLKVTVDGVEFSANPAESREFDAALSLLRKGEFAPAQTAFLDFINRYPTTGYRPSALFWLGNAQYALRAYREAVTNFRALISTAPDHLRAPEAALSIANCQIELKDVPSARKTWTDLIKVYPQSEAASVAKDRLSKLR